MELEELIDVTIADLQQIPGSIAHNALPEDQEQIRRLLHNAAAVASAAINGDEEAMQTLKHAEAGLKELGIKYGLNARNDLQSALNRFFTRAINVLLDATIPG